MAGAVRRVHTPDGFPYGTTKVGTSRSSTGIYGKRVGGTKQRADAVRVKRGRR